jgi:hypothetical protein
MSFLGVGGCSHSCRGLRARVADPWISVWCSDTLTPYLESCLQP